jgi:hypothetical protein
MHISADDPVKRCEYPRRWLPNWAVDLLLRQLSKEKPRGLKKAPGTFHSVNCTRQRDCDGDIVDTNAYPSVNNDHKAGLHSHFPSWYHALLAILSQGCSSSSPWQVLSQQNTVQPIVFVASHFQLMLLILRQYTRPQPSAHRGMPIICPVCSLCPFCNAT